MKPHDERAKVEGLLQWLHPDNPDLKLECDKLQIVLQKVAIQVLLDIRDTLYQMSANQGVEKWGPKIPLAQQAAVQKVRPPTEPPTVSIIGEKEGTEDSA